MDGSVIRRDPVVGVSLDWGSLTAGLSLAGGKWGDWIRGRVSVDMV